MKIILFTNKNKDPKLTVTGRITDILGEHLCLFYENDTEVFNGADAALSLGGDGTFLRCAKLAVPYNVPVLGIHLGHTGFLSRINPSGLEKLRELSQFHIREHTMLDAVLFRGGVEHCCETALNDIVFSRGAEVQTVSLEMDVDGCSIGSFLGDGVIISTATGSTGYALSAGGPVADPDLNIMLVTPVCAHTSHDHAFVLSNGRTITVRPSHAERRHVFFSSDGCEPIRLEPGDVVRIRVSSQVLRCLEPTGHDFFDNVRIHRM